MSKREKILSGGHQFFRQTLLTQAQVLYHAVIVFLQPPPHLPAHRTEKDWLVVLKEAIV